MMRTLANSIRTHYMEDEDTRVIQVVKVVMGEKVAGDKRGWLW